MRPTSAGGRPSASGSFASGGPVGPVGHALVRADGSLGPLADLDTAWPGWSSGIDWVIAADGGARHAQALGRTIDRWVGDGDSLGDAGLAELAAAGVSIERSPTDKDESDTELAVLAAVGTGARRITILGALGGARVDHGLANIWLLSDARLGGHEVVLVDAVARIRLATAGWTDLGGRSGDLITLLAFGGEAIGVTTTGLRYPLVAEDLPSGPARGLSNVRVAEEASLTVGAGRVLVIETPARLHR